MKHRYKVDQQVRMLGGQLSTIIRLLPRNPCSRVFEYKVKDANGRQQNISERHIHTFATAMLK